MNLWALAPIFFKLLRESISARKASVSILVRVVGTVRTQPQEEAIGYKVTCIPTASKG